MTDKPTLSFQSKLQYRDVAFVGGDVFFAAGGLHPMSRSRSAYCATLGCFDTNGRTIWETTIPKCWPFTRVVANSRQVAAIIPSNFVREFCGLVIFDACTGSIVAKLPVDADDLALSPEGNVAIGAHRGVSVVRVVKIPEAIVIRTCEFSPEVEFASKAIKRVRDFRNEQLLITFDCQMKSAYRASHEVWPLDASQPAIRIVEKKRNECLLIEDRIITWEWNSDHGTIAFYSLQDGKQLGLVDPKRGPLETVACYSKDLVIACFDDGQLASIHLPSGEVRPIANLSPEAGWNGIRPLTESNRFLLMETGNHQAPRTDFSIWNMADR